MGQDPESEGEHGGGLFDSLGSLEDHRCFRLVCADQPGLLVDGAPWPGLASATRREPFDGFSELRQLPNGCALFQMPCSPAQGTAMDVEASSPAQPVLEESDVTVAVASSELVAATPTSLSSGPRPNIRARLQPIPDQPESKKREVVVPARPKAARAPQKCKKQKRKAPTKSKKQKENMKPRRMLPRRECCSTEGNLATREPKPEPPPEPEPEPEPESLPEPVPQARPPEAKILSPAMSNTAPSDVDCSSDSMAISPSGPSRSKPSGGRIRLPDKAVHVLRAWMAANPRNFKPDDEEFWQLVTASGLKASQVSNWFSNRKRQLKRPKNLRKPSTSSTAALEE